MFSTATGFGLGFGAGFGADQTHWTGDGGNLLASNVANWDSEVPSLIYVPVFDGVSGGSPNKDCTWDIAEVAFIDEQAAYTGTVTILTGQTSAITGSLTVGAGAGFTMQTGAILNLTGALVLDVAAVVDLQLGSTLNSSGDLNFPAATVTIVCNGTINAGIGGTTFDFINSSLTPRIHIFTLADGCTCNSSGTCYVDTIQGPATEGQNATIIGTGNFIILTAIINLSQITINGTNPSDVQFIILYTALTSGDFGNAEVRFNAVGPNTITGTEDFKCASLGVFMASQNSTTVVSITGNINAIITSLLSIGETTNTRGGEFTWNSTGTLTAGSIKVFDNDGIQTTKFIIGALAGPINIGSGGFITENPSEIDFSASSALFSVSGVITMHPSTTVNWGDVTGKLIGGANQTIDFGGNAPDTIINTKSGGITAFITAFTLALGYISRPTGATTTKFTVGQVFVIDHFDLANPLTDRETIDSSDGATPVAVTTADVGPTGTNTDVGRITLSVGTQFMDSGSCTDLGGNTKFLFDSFPPTIAGFGIGGRGIGVGVGGGGAAFLP